MIVECVAADAGYRSDSLEDNGSGRAAQGNGKENINTTQKINFKRS